MTEPIFDEAARLYAENFEIVSNAAEAYQRAAKSCVAALEKQTRSCLGRTSLGSFSTKKGNPHGYWWTGAGDWKNRPYLWFAMSDPREIDHIGMWLWCFAPDACSAQQRMAVQSIEIDDRLQPDRQPGGGALFAICVPFEGSDFVPAAAQHIASVLQCMSDAFDKAAIAAPAKKRRSSAR
ncbi:MAG: hypothetical protein IT375_33000 [Polyangiaceae bacterium]|nr:hypothetical protein [Polyangiaceae bacterium]